MLHFFSRSIVAKIPSDRNSHGANRPRGVAANCRFAAGVNASTLEDNDRHANKISVGTLAETSFDAAFLNRLNNNAGDRLLL